MTLSLEAPAAEAVARSEAAGSGAGRSSSRRRWGERATAAPGDPTPGAAAVRGDQPIGESVTILSPSTRYTYTGVSESSPLGCHWNFFVSPWPL